ALGVHLAGVGIALAEDPLVVDPPFLDFGVVSVVGEVSRSLAVTNKGLAPVQLTDLMLVDPNQAFALVDPPMLPLALDPGQQLAVEVKFMAEGAAATFTAQVELAYSADGIAYHHDVAVAATGAYEGWRVEPLVLSFHLALGTLAPPQSIHV